jgi:non-ribosomal peptide synthetase component F
LFMTLLASFQTLLYRYTRQRVMIIGVDITNRNRVETESLIGFFTNHLPIRTDLSGNPTFRQLLGRVREVALEAYAHQDLPFDRLVDSLHLDRTLNYTPLFQVLFSFLNKRKDSLEFPNLTVSRMELHASMAKYDLTLFVEETKDGIIATCNYKTDLFADTTINRILGRFERLLESISQDPDARISHLEFFTEAEKAGRSAEVSNHIVGDFKKFKNAAPKAMSLPPGD